MAPDPRTALADGPLPLRIGWPGGWHGSGLEIPLRATGRLRAQWWPLPAAEDRPWLEALLAADDLPSQMRLSEALAEAVDRCVRERLQRPTAKEPKPAPSRRRQTLPEAWLRALRTVDAAIATSADASTQAALLAGSAPG